MNIIIHFVLALQILTALVMIGLVLIQHGKGADMGASFGSGASGSLFGASGSANFLSRFTAVLAVIFFITSLSLTYIATHRTTGATTGFPMWAAMGTKEAGGISVGVSPANSEKEHIETYNLPVEYMDLLLYTGFGYPGRDIETDRAIVKLSARFSGQSGFSQRAD